MKKALFWLLFAAIVAACSETDRGYGDGVSKAGSAGEGGDTGDEAPAGAAGQENGAGAPALGACDVRSEGEPCGLRTCEAAFGECNAADVCTRKGKWSRLCRDWVCKDGECQAVDVTETASCARDTEGNSCGEHTCPDWGGCSYGSTCANGGTRSRTCSDHVCAAGVCKQVALEETDTSACGRNTDGESCGTTDCGSCSYANSCDETAQKKCTEYLCDGGSCEGNTFSATYACPTRDVCSPAAKESCTFWEDDCACSGQRTCSDSCGWGSCVRVTGGCSCP